MRRGCCPETAELNATGPKTTAGALSATPQPVMRPALIERYSCSRPIVLSVITKLGFVLMSARVMSDCGHDSISTRQDSG
jgi:hypothetical protein